MKEKYLYIWTMFHLTCEINTLVITLRKPQSKMGRLILAKLLLIVKIMLCGCDNGEKVYE